MTVHRQHIGLGPMGTAVFYAAHNMGMETFERLFDGGVALVERSIDTVGSGQFHDLVIDTNSDPADSIRFVPSTWPFGVAEASRALRRALEDASDQDFCNFRELSAYYHATGRELVQYARERTDGSCFLEAEVDHIAYDRKGRTFTSFDTGNRLIAQSSELVLATGGMEKIHADLRAFGDRVIASRNVMTSAKKEVKAALARAAADEQRTIVILGSGNSAISALGELVHLQEAQGFKFVVAHRSPLLLNYPSLEAALRDGYVPQPAELSNQEPYPVNRVRGLRLAAQAILHDALDGTLGPVTFVRFDGNLQQLPLLNDAGVIIQAFGYKGNTPRLVDPQGQGIPLKTKDGLVVVTEHDQLVTRDGMPIEHAYRVGMGTLKTMNWKVPGYEAESALTSGPIAAVKAYQGPGGSGESLLTRLLANPPH